MPAESVHCTSFGVPNNLPLKDFKLPCDLQNALKSNLTEQSKDSQLCKNYIKLIKSFSSIRKIEHEYYFILFKILLYMEANELERLAAEHNLKNQVLKESGHAFVVTVPLLDEDNPFVIIGTQVIIQLTSSQRKFYSKIVAIVGKNVSICLINPNHKEMLVGQKVNVQFCPLHWNIMCSHYALNVVFKHKLVNLMYPKIDTAYSTLLPKFEDFEWFHKTVSENPEQKQAVNNIIKKSEYSVPYILFGPPGTGKTMTLVESICQIRKLYKSKKILVCTSSNAAADEIAKRLLALLPSTDIFRMYSASKCWEEIHKDICPSSNFIDKMVFYLPKEILILKKIVIATLVTSVRLARLKLHQDHFSYIFIDEGSQSMEPESLIPFALSSSYDETAGGTLHAQIIIAGDPYQLGPVVHCKRIEHLLGQSLLERLMECEPYQKVDNKYNPRYITKLVRNYRSQEPILHVSNKLFYNSELCCNASNTKKITLNWPELSNKAFPLIFFVTKGKEVKDSKSVYNDEEIKVVTHYVKKLLRAKHNKRQIQQADIGIVTPFKKHQIMIRKNLNNFGLNNISVGTVETYQGQEKEIIILTTARSKCFYHDGKQHIGLLSNPKRFNVALTRAKNLLIIIGNPLVLCKDPHWNALWKYCKQHNACVPVNMSSI